MKYVLIIFVLFLGKIDGFAQIQTNGNFTYYPVSIFNNKSVYNVFYNHFTDELYVQTVESVGMTQHYYYWKKYNDTWTEFKFKDIGYDLSDTVYVKNIDFGKDGSMWLGTKDKLVKIINDISHEYHISSIQTNSENTAILSGRFVIDSTNSPIFPVLIGNYNEQIFVYNQTGLYRIENDEFKQIYTVLTNNGVAVPSCAFREFTVDKEGIVWMAQNCRSTSNEGLFKYNPYNDEHNIFKVETYEKNSYHNIYPYSLHTDENGNIVLFHSRDTQNNLRGGISIFNPQDNTWKTFDEKDGLSIEPTALLNQIEMGAALTGGVYFLNSQKWGYLLYDSKNKEVFFYKPDEIFDLTSANTKYFFNYDQITVELGEGKQDVWTTADIGLVKYHHEPGASFTEDSKSFPSARIYPVPAFKGNFISFELSNEIKSGIEIRISDISGKMFETNIYNINNKTFQIETANLNAGIYYIKIGELCLPFVIQ